jgi:hypothetical protein
MLWRAPTNSPGVPAAWEGVAGVGGGGGREGEEQGVCHFNSREWQLPCAKNVSPLPTQPPPPASPGHTVPHQLEGTPLYTEKQSSGSAVPQ